MRQERDEEYDRQYQEVVRYYNNKKYIELVLIAQWFEENYAFPLIYSVAMFAMASYLHLGKYHAAHEIGKKLYVEYEQGRLPERHHFALLFNLAFVSTKVGEKYTYTDLMQQARAVAEGDEVEKVEAHLQKFFHLTGGFSIGYEEKKK